MNASLLRASLVLVVALFVACGQEENIGDEGGTTTCTVAADCDDQNFCTEDDCAEGECLHSNNTAQCDDGDSCTAEDVCSGGTCSGEPLDSDADGYVSDVCPGGTDCDDTDDQVHPGSQEAPYGDPICTDTVDNDCDGLTDSSDNGCQGCAAAVDCDDQNPCTDDDCTAGACVYSNSNAQCDDGDPCTMEDVCSGGACAGEPLDNDGDGYVSDVCPGGTDCDDSDDQVSPGDTEGPEGNATCSDTADNDCDGNVDSEDSGCSPTSALAADHSAVADFNLIPETALDQAKATFRIAYGHTSHGSQIVSGMSVLAGLDSLYAYSTGGGPGVLSLHDRTPGGDLGNPDRTTWAQRTRDLLDAPGNDRNLIIWSWCGQADTTETNMDLYLSLMDQLETDYPGVTFVYMTGHLNGTGEGGNLHQRNEQIRTFCQANDKALFDFADIESYDPDGAYFLDRGANDNCGYSGGNWATEWCNAHPASELCLPCSCAHSQALNCNLKARAFWWMLARLAGWDGP